MQVLSARTTCFNDRHISNQTELKNPSSCQAIDKQIKPTRLSAYEERGPVGTEHLSPKLHWLASLPSRYATDCMHHSLNCTILETLVTTWDIFTVCNTAIGLLNNWPVFYTKRKQLDSRCSSERCLQNVLKTYRLLFDILAKNWKLLVFKNTSRISCPISLHSQGQYRDETAETALKNDPPVIPTRYFQM